MAIVTLPTVKSLLNIDSTGQDTWIAALIPVVESDYESIRNKPFDTCVTLTIDSDATADGDVALTISDANTEFEYIIAVKGGDSALLVAQRIADYFRHTKVRASGNDVVFITSGIVLEFDAGATGVTATVTGMATCYPVNAEFTAAKMINYHMATKDAMGKQSESLGDYSVTYDRGVTSADYPNDIVGGIKRYVSLS